MRSYLLQFGLVVAVVAVLVLLLLPSIRPGREASRRSQCRNNLKQIAMSLHQYHEEYGSFPPAVVYDAEGRPAHSWRVLLLPFLEQKKLYDEYRFDQPWNSPHNSKLAERIPEVYRCPSAGREHSELNTADFKVLTHYVAAVSPDAVFHGKRVTKIEDIADGTSNTILVAEACQHAVHWMQPEDVTPQELITDLHYSKIESLGNHYGGLHVALADGSVRFITSRIEPSVFFSLITRDGNEVIPEY